MITSPARCEELCRTTPECAAWTWADEDFFYKDFRQTCWLKKALLCPPGAPQFGILRDNISATLVSGKLNCTEEEMWVNNEPYNSGMGITGQSATQCFLENT